MQQFTLHKGQVILFTGKIYETDSTKNSSIFREGGGWAGAHPPVPPRFPPLDLLVI